MDEDIIAKVREVIGEYYPNWAFVCLDHEDEFFYDYSNIIVGEALLHKALQDMGNVQIWTDVEFEEDWGDDWEDEGEGWKA